MLFHVYAFCWNDETLIPAFLKHYEQADEIFVYDNMSTDSSASIVELHGRKVIPYDTNNCLNDKVQGSLRSSIWENSKGKADFVIIQDLDEFIHFPNFPNDLKGALQDLKEKNVTSARSICYNIIFEDQEWLRVLENIENISSISQIFKGKKDNQAAINSGRFDKVLVFNPNVFDSVTFSMGGHSWVPKPAVNNRPCSEPDRPILVHYKHLGKHYEYERRVVTRERIKHQWDKNGKGPGNHYNKTDEQIKKLLEEWYQGPYEDMPKILFPNFFRVQISQDIPTIFLKSEVDTDQEWLNLMITKCSKNEKTLVIDIGNCLNGLFGIACISAGAKKAICLEKNKDNLKNLCDTFRANDFSKLSAIDYYNGGNFDVNLDGFDQILAKIDIGHMLNPQTVEKNIMKILGGAQEMLVICLKFEKEKFKHQAIQEFIASINIETFGWKQKLVDNYFFLQK